MLASRTLRSLARHATRTNTFSQLRHFSAAGTKDGISLTYHDDGFADVTMCRPERFNTFDDALILRFSSIWEELAQKDGLRGVFIKAEPMPDCKK